MADSLVEIPTSGGYNATCRASEIALLDWDRGHSYTTLKVHLHCGQIFEIRDYNGNTYELSTKLRTAMKEALNS